MTPSPLSARSIGLLALGLATGLAVLLPQLRPVLPVDETRYLSVAWEMQRDGSFIVPHLNGEIYAHKPPLLFWLINLVWSAIGVSEVAARLVAPAFGVLAVALTWRVGARLFPDRPTLGPTAALILASTGVFALYGSLTMFDTMLASAVLLGVLALVRMDAGGGWPATLGLGAALAFGVLAKGPVILVHLMPLALARPVWSLAEVPGRAGAWYGRVAVAIAMAVGPLALWLIPALWLGGADYRAEVLWRQSAGRMVNAFDHARPVWFFLALLPLLLWPWAWRPQALRGLASAGLWSDRRARVLVVGARGFEPPTPCSRSRCATRLRYAPTVGGGLRPSLRLWQGAAARRHDSRDQPDRAGFSQPQMPAAGTGAPIQPRAVFQHRAVRDTEACPRAARCRCRGDDHRRRRRRSRSRCPR
jgi:4-amino-4-deoxy-L-arabinose transferase-like glycosyltransferase